MENKKQKVGQSCDDAVRNISCVGGKISGHDPNIEDRCSTKNTTGFTDSGLLAKGLETPPGGINSRSSTRAPSINSIEAVLSAGPMETKSGDLTSEKGSDSDSSSVSSAETDESESDASPSCEETGDSDDDP